MATYTYDPSQVAALLGATSINGWNEVSIEFDEDDWGFDVGNNGDTSRVYNVNKLAVVTMKLQQTSPSNLAFTAARNAKSVLPISVIDTSGGSSFLMPEGTIMKAPTVTFGKGTDVNEIEWQLKGTMKIAIYGGNGPIIPAP